MTDLPNIRKMFTHMHQPHYIFTGTTDEGFCAAEVDTSGDRFSITGSMYPSEEAYKLGNAGAVFACGCIHDSVAAAVPELAPFIPLHLSHIETGEPYGIANALRLLKPDGELTHERTWRAKNGRKNYFASPDDDSLLHDYFIGQAAKLLRIKDADTLKTLLVERANERFPADEDEEPWTFEDVITSDILNIFWEELLMFMAPTWREESVEFSLFLEQQPAPSLTPDDEPSSEFEHKFDNGLAVQATIKDGTMPSPIMKGESVYGYKVIVKLDGKRRTFHATGSVADYWNSHKDAKGAAWGILREIGSIYLEGEEFWAAMEINPESVKARKGEADAKLFGEAIEANMNVIGI